MYISWIQIKGFRNFHDETIHFADKTLIIGTNDVGKTNLLYALRIFFDKNLSERDLELTDSDYNAYSHSDEIEITVAITNITEACLLSTFMGDIKDGTTYLRYTNSKNGIFCFWGGYKPELLEEKSPRYYIRRLNLECVDTNRDLFSYLRRERNNLLDISRQKRTEIEVQEDEMGISQIQTDLDSINEQIESLHYIASSLSIVNEEFSKLSLHNEDQDVRFVSGNSDARKMLTLLDLAYNADNIPLSIGGDGRNNQIFLATWISQKKIDTSSDHITFFAFEELEAHLHPHQQRKLSKYIIDSFNTQVFITTHSPHIAAEFRPERIVRLYSKNKFSYAAQGGCCHKIKRTFDDFGYRLNAISAEVFFSDGVLLVEGISEKLLYTALAPYVDVDIDRMNLTICSVEGIGFKPYIKVCQALGIPFVVRTDDDTFVKEKKGKKYSYFAGISRVFGIYKELIASTTKDSILSFWKINGIDNEWPESERPPRKAFDLNNKMRELLDPYNIFLSVYDLETDLARSELSESLIERYDEPDIDKLILLMKKRKAENMLEYLSEHEEDLEILTSDNISTPLIRIAELIEKGVHPCG